VKKGIDDLRKSEEVNESRLVSILRKLLIKKGIKFEATVIGSSEFKISNVIEFKSNNFMVRIPILKFFIKELYLGVNLSTYKIDEVFLERVFWLLEMILSGKIILPRTYISF